ncbi:MAG: hypothetical protein V1857_06205 [archaeon]
MSHQLWAARTQETAVPLKPHKSPAKNLRDRERAIRYRHEEIKKAELRNKVSQILESARKTDEKQLEMLMLFGYYESPDGLAFSVGQTRTLAKGMKDPDIFPKEIVDFGQLVFHSAEAVTDVLESKGEVNSTQFYPALGIMAGEVLRDRKIGFVCPLLKMK